MYLYCILNELIFPKKLSSACSQMDFVSVPSGRRDSGGGWVSKKLPLSDSVPFRPYPSSHNLGNLILWEKVYLFVIDFLMGSCLSIPWKLIPRNLAFKAPLLRAWRGGGGDLWKLTPAAEDDIRESPLKKKIQEQVIQDYCNGCGVYGSNEQRRGWDFERRHQRPL